MTSTTLRSAHTFHIPVMGTGFTIDTPLRLAKYGISSVISLVDDVLIEQMRKFHCEQNGEKYEEITPKDDDARAHRITAYLNLVDRLVQKQVLELQASPFEKGSEITRYYDLLPECSLKQEYRNMQHCKDPSRKKEMQEKLRLRAVPGSIDVNIMTKLNIDVYERGIKGVPENAHALAALRGYANSTLHSSIVFSAGINQRLYSYLTKFNDFYPDQANVLNKKIILKVSDYRSAVVQGKILAKKGLWVSEYRIESGLNCGGHAFATKGHLMGPILEEFKSKRSELLETQFTLYQKTLTRQERPVRDTPPDMYITVQGGIGTAEENAFLINHYHVDSTGWATPFLLVPEATNVDQEHLEKLAKASDGDVYLSDSSPLNIPFWNLRNSGSEEARRHRIQDKRPGSPCPKGFLTFDSEFTPVPICTASRAYQKRKLQYLSTNGHSEEQAVVLRKQVESKSCICHDLAGSVTLKNKLDDQATPAVCCGPNIVNFSRICSLEEMIGHIYGRLSLLTQPERPHMFLRELQIYIDYLRQEIQKYEWSLSPHTPAYFSEFKANLLSGIDYYRTLFKEKCKEFMLDELTQLYEEIETACLTSELEPA